MHDAVTNAMRAILFLLMAAVPLACTTHRLDGNLPAYSPSNALMLSPVQLQQTTSRALNGDVVAMKALHDHYGIANGDREKSIYWLERAANAGDLESQQGVLCYYTMIRDTKTVTALEKRWMVTSQCAPRVGT